MPGKDYESAALLMGLLAFNDFPMQLDFYVYELVNTTQMPARLLARAVARRAR